MSVRRLAVITAFAIAGLVAACADDNAELPIVRPPATLAQLTGPWQAAPLRLDPVMWGTIEDACRRDIEFPVGAHALHIEVRGGGVAIVRMTGAQSGTCYALQIMADGHVSGAGPGARSETSEHWVIPAGATLGPVEQQTVEGGDLKVTGWSVNGPVGAGIGTVIVQPLGQPQIVATVMNGWFSAWWPVPPPPQNQQGVQLPPPGPLRIQGFDANGQLVNEIRG